MNVAFYTIGCRLNQAETAVLENRFRQSGYEIVDFNRPADLVVINTCTVTENSDADTRRAINKARRTNPAVKIALTGCQAQTQGPSLLGIENVQWIVGNGAKLDLATIIREHHNGVPQLFVPPLQRDAFTMPAAGIDRKHTRANLKIQDGCNFFCSFCEIPYARGRARSRVFQDVVDEAHQLVSAGHREIILTGVNIGCYAYENYTLLDIVSALESIPELQRIRLSSLEGTTVSPNMFRKMVDGSKLCRHLHLSIQSASDTILQRMNRHYSVGDFGALLQTASTTVKGICLGTDVIVGFPGESDALFEETCANLRAMPLAYFHVFSYSKRPFAKSRDFPDPVPKTRIEQRSRVLRELSARKRRLFFESQLGKTLPVLFEQKKNGYWTGLTDSYIRVKVQSKTNLKNKIEQVTLTEIDGQTVIGRLF